MNTTLLRSAVGTTKPWKTLEVDGINLAYNDDGEGLTIVCLHAIGHGAGDFKLFRKGFCDRYRVIAIDFPSHGNSDSDTQPASSSRYAELIGLFLDKLAIEKVVLIGNSIGGAAAIQYAFAHLHRVQGLVLENPGGLDPSDNIKTVFTRLMAKLFSQGIKKSWFYSRGFADYYRYLVLPTPEAQEHREKIIASAYEIAPCLSQAWQSFGDKASDLRHMVQSINCPVLLAWASRDKIVQLDRCLPTIKHFPKAKLEIFEAGHCPHLETPKKFEFSVKSFLQELECDADYTTNY